MNIRSVLGCVLTISLLTVPAMPTVPAQAAGGLLPGDPMVRITAPPGVKVDKAAALAAISRDVSRDTGLKENLITFYWQTFDAVHCMGEPSPSKPMFVDLYVPGFLTDKEVQGIMEAIATSIAKHVAVERKWVFIHTHTAAQGRVFLSDKVQFFDPPN